MCRVSCQNAYSTDYAILQLVNQTTEAFSQGNYSTLGIFNDLSEAFDTFNRGILQEKLKAYGIQSENRPCDQTNLVLNSIEKIKLGFLLFFMCIFPESNGTKLYLTVFTSEIQAFLQTRMDQRGDTMRNNFQIRKWISQTVRAQKLDEKNGIICVVSFSGSWVNPRTMYFCKFVLSQQDI